jgi:hypothetical protein
MLIEKIIQLVSNKEITEANPFAKNTGIGYASNPQSGSPASPSGNRSLRQQQLRSFNAATNRAPERAGVSTIAAFEPVSTTKSYGLDTAPRGDNLNTTSISKRPSIKQTPVTTTPARRSAVSATSQAPVTVTPARRPPIAPIPPKKSLANQVPGSRQTAPRTGGGSISTVRQKPSYEPSPLTSFARGAADSATFGAAKYARAAAETGVKKLLGRNTSFQKELDQEQEKQNIAQAKNPVSYKAGEYAPLVAGGAGVVKGLAKGAGAVVKNVMKNGKGPELKDYYPPKALPAPSSTTTTSRALPAPPTSPTASSPPTTPRLPGPSTQPPAPKPARLGKVDGDKQTMYYNGRQVPFSKLRIVNGQIKRAN